MIGGNVGHRDKHYSPQMKCHIQEEFLKIKIMGAFFGLSVKQHIHFDQIFLIRYELPSTEHIKNVS